MTYELPDGSGFDVASFPLPKDHWITQEGRNIPPAGLRVGTDNPLRNVLATHITDAARYAIRGATMNGQEDGFDPDALVQNMIVGLLGVWTPDGHSRLA